MKVILTESYEESAKITADLIQAAVSEKPDLLLGLATGGTMEGVYANVVEMYKEGKIDFSNARTVNLDEYINCDDKDSYRRFMDDNLFDHINVPKENIVIANYEAEPNAEVARLRKFFSENRVDLQLLGIGANGHIGFNEPGESLNVMTYIEELTESTIEANARFFENAEKVPRSAITMGMGDIMNAHQILLVVHGESKRAVLAQLLDGSAVTPNNPASFLLLHPNVTLIAQK